MMIGFPQQKDVFSSSSSFVLYPEDSLWHQARGFQDWLQSQTERIQAQQLGLSDSRDWRSEPTLGWSQVMQARLGSAWVYWAYELGILLEPSAFASHEAITVQTVIPAIQAPLTIAVMRPTMVWVGIDWQEGTLHVAWHVDTPTCCLESLCQAVSDIQASMFQRDKSTSSSLEAMTLPETITWGMSEVTYSEAVCTLQQGITQGAFYQANLSLQARLTMPQGYEPLSDWFARYIHNPSPFSALWYAPWSFQGQAIASQNAPTWLLCHSPERLVLQEPVADPTASDTLKTWRLSTRPIAGTRSRGETHAEQRTLEAALKTLPKEQAEHTMLVDLLRNDLGRLCEAGSVNVTEYQTLELYRYVTHLVSEVEGYLRASKVSDLPAVFSLLQAMFPGGTITGCPKWRCMAWLFKQEVMPRGFYTGSCGYWQGATGTLDWNILIRSAMYYPDTHLLVCHGGAGIVADSIPSHEYRESLKKMRHFTQYEPS
jgi:anthranilate/para-aminobenzoate synthase component I